MDNNNVPNRTPRPLSGHRGSYAHEWRQVFSRGALDALRCAAREIDDPRFWPALDRLAEQYELAADD